MKTVSQILEEARQWADAGCVEGSKVHKTLLDIYNGHKPLARNYKVKPTDHWCATFISTIFIVQGCEVILGGTECSCGRMIEKMQKAGIWIEDEKILPKPGDIIFYDWDAKDGWPEHVGIVESVKGKVITVIEGNYNNTVGRRVINQGWNMIRGYGRPKYTPALDNTEYNSPTKSLRQVAAEVIHGQWGNGSSRTSALKKAGYDPNEVQKMVNELLKSHPQQKFLIDIAKEVINGEWGTGTARINALKKAGYDPVAVQKQVNLLVKGNN